MNVLVEEEEGLEIVNLDPQHREELKRLITLKVALSDAKMIANVDHLENWLFDVLDYSTDELFQVTKYLFEVLNLVDDFNLSNETFDAFLGVVSQKYIATNPYHNFGHGVDVMFTVYRLLMDSKIHLVFSQVEMLAIMTGALVHDVGHPGVNNVYLVKAKHSFALMHNDRSPLENMHCAVVYEILSIPETNLFASLSEEQWRESRQVMLTAILGTDMSHHFEQISKTQLFLEVNRDDVHGFCAGDKEETEVFKEMKDRHFMLELCLHCADISNPYKPFAMCKKWAYLVVEEFGLQADREKAEGLEVSPMMDRDQINVFNMQMGFVEFVVAPLILTVINILYPLYPIGFQMLENYLEWAQLRRNEISADVNIIAKDEEAAKLDNRIANFKKKFDFLDQLEAKPQRSDKSRSRQFLLKDKKGGGSGGSGSRKGAGTGGPVGVSSPKSRKILGKD